MFSLLWAVVFWWSGENVPLVVQVVVHVPFLVVDMELGWALYKKFWKVVDKGDGCE